MKRLFALLLAVSLFAIPSAAVAQSAGDEQYNDPFGEVEEPGGSQDQPAETPEAAPAPTPEPAQSGDALGESEPEIVSDDSPTLPITGGPVALLAGAGALLLAGGAALRRRAS